MIADVRTDPFIFYAVSMISFLESAVANYVDSLQPFFGDSPDTWRWLRDTWQSEEAAHGRITRAFVERKWPEFDWKAGYSDFLDAYTPRCKHDLLQPTRSLEALARCVTETGAAMMYRCLATYTSDPELKLILSELSRDEIRHYTYFRDLFHQHDADERNSFFRKASTILARGNLVQEEDAAMAFAPLNGAWRAHKPFQPFDYATMLRIAGKVMSLHFPLVAAKRMLFRPLKSESAWEKAGIGVLAAIMQKRFRVEA